MTLAIIASFTMTSCDTATSPITPEILEITGTWIDDYSTMIISGDSWESSTTGYPNWDLTGEIVSYNNDSYNLASENPTSGDYGHLVVKITTGGAAVTDQIGTYKVIRWKNLKSVDSKTSLLSSESYKYGSAWFISDSEATTMATEANGYFSSYTGKNKE